MIDYKDLHAKIKAKLKPDSPMPEGYQLFYAIPGSNEAGFVAKMIGTSNSYLFLSDFDYSEPCSVRWFANALQIPLEDNGYTDLVKAAEREIEINTAFRAGLSAEEMEEWESYSNDGEIALGAALERIKSENP